MCKRFGTLVLVVFVIFALGLAGCGGGGGGGNGDDTGQTDDPTDPGDGDDGTDGGETPALYDRTVYVNPDDSMLYSFTSEDGEAFTYYGLRDADGMPQVITMVEYVDVANERFFIYYDHQGLPAKIIDENGATLEFGYYLEDIEGPVMELSADLPVAKAITAIDVRVSLRESDGVTEASAIVPLDDTVLVAPDPRMAEWPGNEIPGNVMIRVDQCGRFVRPDGEVWVIYQDHGKTSRHPAYPMSDPGYYMSQVPQDYIATPEDVENTCKSFADALDTACSVFDVKAAGVPAYILMTNPGFQAAICGAVAAEVSLVATPAFGAVAGGACGALLVGGTITCNTLGKSVPGHPNYMDTFLCSQVEEQLEALNATTGADKVTLQAVADFSKTQAPSLSVPGDSHPGVYASPKLEVSVFDPYPTLEISASDPSIGRITTFPGSPKAGEPYTLTAHFTCVSGSDLAISVARDGVPLAHERRYGDTPQKSISFTVPGDPPGSVDTITVSVRDPSTGALATQKSATIHLQAYEPPGDQAFNASVNIPGQGISFNPVNTTAGITMWFDRQDAVGIVAAEGNTQESEYLSITFNPHLVDGPGTYELSRDMEASAAAISFGSPEIRHADVNHPIAGTLVYFIENGGTFTIDQWGTAVGDVVSGSFAAQITGTRITGQTSDGGTLTEELNGSVTGSFNLEIVAVVMP